MKIVQTPTFSRAVKKLHASQKKDLDRAIKTLIENPYSGDAKTGDLANVLVYKFRMSKQLALLAYTYEATVITLTLLAVGMHENFYRDLKKSV